MCSAVNKAEDRQLLVDRFNAPMSQPNQAPIKVLVMSFFVSDVGHNLWAECYENVVLESARSYSVEYQGWVPDTQNRSDTPAADDSTRQPRHL